MLAAEPRGEAMRARLKAFRNDVLLSKLRLMSLIRDYKEKGVRICGISAPSRASTLFNYVGLDDGIIDYVCEIAGSLKIGKCMPGTAIPVVEESRLFDGPARGRDHLLLAYRRRACAQAAGQGLSRQARDAAAGPARALDCTAIRIRCHWHDIGIGISQAPIERGLDGKPWSVVREFCRP